MPIIEVDGLEIDTAPEVPVKAHLRRNRFARSNVPRTESERQRFERGVRTIFDKALDFATGDGDDVDRALRMIGDATKKEDEAP